MKPENLLYVSKEADAELKLADFGFAKIDRGDLVTPVCVPRTAPEMQSALLPAVAARR